jgi:UDP-N-acetylmuramoylalanine--D-glutamate ligase
MALNLGAAILLTQPLGVSHTRINVGALEALPHRMEPVPSADGRTWLNDSKATNVDAARVGIAAAPRGCTLLLGGKGKDGADYTALAPAIRAQADRVVVFGATGNEIAAALRPLLPSGSVEVRSSLLEAVAEATIQTPAGRAILLCPACASFDEFQNFEHRGDVFRTLAAAAPEASP